MNFDKLTDRRGSGCNKWDKPQRLYDVPDDCLPMWVADTDFELPEFVIAAGRRMLDHGIFGYGYIFNCITFLGGNETATICASFIDYHGLALDLILASGDALHSISFLGRQRGEGHFMAGFQLF